MRGIHLAFFSVGKLFNEKMYKKRARNMTECDGEREGVALGIFVLRSLKCVNGIFSEFWVNTSRACSYQLFYFYFWYTTRMLFYSFLLPSSPLFIYRSMFSVIPPAILLFCFLIYFNNNNLLVLLPRDHSSFHFT